MSSEFTFELIVVITSVNIELTKLLVLSKVLIRADLSVMVARYEKIIVILLNVLSAFVNKPAIPSFTNITAIVSNIVSILIFLSKTQIALCIKCAKIFNTESINKISGFFSAIKSA